MNELLADLRNKLSPLVNYFAVKRDYDQLKANPSNTSTGGFLDGMKMADLEAIIKKEQINCENNIAQIQYILDSMTKLLEKESSSNDSTSLMFVK